MQSDIVPTYPKPTAQAAVFFDILGVPLAVKFLMKFGGGEFYFPKRADSSHELVKLVGQDLTDKLGEAANIPRRIPLAKPWLALYFASQGEDVTCIARKLRASDTAVRKWNNGND